MHSQQNDKAVKAMREVESIRYNTSRALSVRLDRIFDYYSDLMADVIDEYNLRVKDADYTEQRKKLTPAQMSRVRNHFRKRLSECEASEIGWSSSVRSKLKAVVSGKRRFSKLDLFILELSCLVMLLYDEVHSLLTETNTRALEEARDRTVFAVQGLKGETKTREKMDPDRIESLLRTKAGERGTLKTRLPYWRSDCDSAIRSRARQSAVNGTLSTLNETIAGWLGTKAYHAKANARSDLVAASTLGQIEGIGEEGVRLVMIDNPMDERTTPICRAMYGTVLPLEDCVPWETAPPFHYNCRSHLVPYGDWEGDADIELSDWLTSE